METLFMINKLSLFAGPILTPEVTVVGHVINGLSISANHDTAQGYKANNMKRFTGKPTLEKVLTSKLYFHFKGKLPAQANP